MRKLLLFLKQLPVDFLVPQVAGKKSGRRRKVGSFAHSHVPGTLEACRVRSEEDQETKSTMTKVTQR